MTNVDPRYTRTDRNIDFESDSTSTPEMAESYSSDHDCLR